MEYILLNNQKLGFEVAVTNFVGWLAVLFEDQLTEEHVEHNNNQANGQPEECRQATNAVTVSVQGEQMLLMGRCLNHFLDMQRMSEIFHVLFVWRYVRDGYERLCELNGELCHRLTKRNWFIETTSIACIVRHLLFFPIYRYVHDGFVVLICRHCYVDVCQITVVEPSEVVVTMQELWMNVELEMLITETEATEAEDHRLYYATSTCLQ